jgi:hypothetical protein
MFLAADARLDGTSEEFQQQQMLMCKREGKMRRGAGDRHVALLIKVAPALYLKRLSGCCRRLEMHAEIRDAGDIAGCKGREVRGRMDNRRGCACDWCIEVGWGELVCMAKAVIICEDGGLLRTSKRVHQSDSSAPRGCTDEYKNGASDYRTLETLIQHARHRRTRLPAFPADDHHEMCMHDLFETHVHLSPRIWVR